VTALTVSGDIEGLLRECSPVGFNVGGVDGVVVGFVHHKGTDNVPLVWWPRDYCGVGKPSYRSSVHLRLDHETGRAHAAWYCGDNAEGEPYTVSHGPDGFAVHGWGSGGVVVEIHADGVVYLFTPDNCDGLGSLDPNDPRLLEDGSRWVDAEALRLVVLHVAGRLP